LTNYYLYNNVHIVQEQETCSTPPNKENNMRVVNLQIRVRQRNHYEPHNHICFEPLGDILIYGKPTIFVKYNQARIIKGGKKLTWKEALVATNPEKFSYIKVGISGEMIMDGDYFHLLADEMIILRTKK
jgi:hypothetical protein